MKKENRIRWFKILQHEWDSSGTDTVTILLLNTCWNLYMVDVNTFFFFFFWALHTSDFWVIIPLLMMHLVKPRFEFFHIFLLFNVIGIYKYEGCRNYRNHLADISSKENSQFSLILPVILVQAKIDLLASSDI